MRVWANTPTAWDFLPLGIQPGEKRFKTLRWRIGCQLLGRYVVFSVGWRFPIQAIFNLATGMVVEVGKAGCPQRDRTVVLGFLNSLAEMEFWITGKPLGGRKSIHDPISRGFVAKVFRSKTS